MKKIKELLHQFGILVIRTIWPGKGKRSAQRLGVIVLGLCALLGVSQASSVQRLLQGSVEGAAETQTKFAAKNAAPMTATANRTAGTASAAEASSRGRIPNIVDLIGESEYIIRGLVKEVTDGIENGVPYTQVTVIVTESIRGQVGSEYTFRQFGLTKPRSMGNGKVNLNVTPDGWSKYAVNDDVTLFLYKRASKTGLQTTTGLGQGKVVLRGGNAVSQFGNTGLFDNVDVDAKLLNDKDKRMLATKKGAVNADGFLSFVRRAVKDKWIERRALRHAKK